MAFRSRSQWGQSRTPEFRYINAPYAVASLLPEKTSNAEGGQMKTKSEAGGGKIEAEAREDEEKKTGEDEDLTEAAAAGEDGEVEDEARLLHVFEYKKQKQTKDQRKGA